jgi:D-lactate dehydrogenase
MIDDDILQRLLGFSNVLITPHQAFFTDEALTQIAKVSLENISKVEKGDKCENVVEPKKKDNKT